MAAIRRDFCMDDLRPSAQAAGVVATVVVQTVTAAAETPELLSLAAGDPLVAGVVGWADLTSPAVAGELAELQAGTGGDCLVGIRHQVQSEPDPDWLRRGDVIRGLRAVAQRRAYATTWSCGRTSSPRPATLQLAVPGLMFVLDHAGKPPIASGDLSAWTAAIVGFAARPNTVCKLSGLVTEAATWRCATGIRAGWRCRTERVPGRTWAHDGGLGLASSPAGKRLCQRGRTGAHAGHRLVGRRSARQCSRRPRLGSTASRCLPLSLGEDQAIPEAGRGADRRGDRQDQADDHLGTGAARGKAAQGG